MTSTDVAIALIETTVTLAQPGFARRHPKYRIAHAVAGCGWAPGQDARSAAYREAGCQAAVEYVRQSGTPDFAAPRHMVAALAARIEAHTGLAGMAGAVGGGR